MQGKVRQNMLIRKAEIKDIEAIDRTYTELLTYEQEHGTTTNWELGVYPTAAVPMAKIPEGTMFVLEDDGEICASMVLNQEQAQEYYGIDWLYPAEDSEVYVIHTLTVPPSKAGRGYGSAMIDFGKEYARQHGAKVLRLDTWLHNEPAKALYRKNGFRISGHAECLHQGLIKSELVYLEYML